MKQKSLVADTDTLRRRLLIGLAQSSIIAVTCTARVQAAACGALSSSNESTRKSLQYTDTSATGKSCSGCAFFMLEDGEACGECQMVHGPVSPTGYCTSWSQRS